jgi:hypothetical protein
MSIDLREKQGTTVRPEAIRSGRPGPGTPWPFIVAGLVLAVVAAVTMLVFTQATEPASVRDHRVDVEGMMTDVREGSGYAPVAGTEPIVYPHGLENPGAYPRTWDPGAYARGALTGSREGSGSGSVGSTEPRPPLGSTRYADGTLTGIG